MIVKKLQRKVICKDYDCKRNHFKEVKTRYYIGYYFLNIIPIYVVLLDEYIEWNYVGDK